MSHYLNQEETSTGRGNAGRSRPERPPGCERGDSQRTLRPERMGALAPCPPCLRPLLNIALPPSPSLNRCSQIFWRLLLSLAQPSPALGSCAEPAVPSTPAKISVHLWEGLLPGGGQVPPCPPLAFCRLSLSLPPNLFYDLPLTPHPGCVTQGTS